MVFKKRQVAAGIEYAAFIDHKSDFLLPETNPKLKIIKGQTVYCFRLPL
jgi:hypothetical protein